MTAICPTITVETPEEYAAQLATVTTFAERIHIDVADNIFTPRQLLPLAQIYLPDNVTSDIHVMLSNPFAELMTLVSLQPNMVVVHAESKGNLATGMAELQKVGIKAGVALLPDTPVASAAKLIAKADHVLIFAGKLGYQGGQADMSQTSKIAEIRALNPTCEIGWDGGVNDQNAADLMAAGATVLNVGGFIHHADDPASAYRTLTNLV